MKKLQLNIIAAISLLILAVIFSCKKNYDSSACDTKLGGQTISKQLVFSGIVIDSCTNQPLSNVMVSIFAYGNFQAIYGHDCYVGSDVYGSEILNVRTDANGKFSVNQSFTLNHVNNIEFYQVNINGYYLYHYTSDPYILYDNYWLSTLYYRVKEVDSLKPKTFIIRNYPKVHFTNCKTLYSDNLKYRFLELYPLRNKNLLTVGNDIILETKDSYHWKALYGDTITSFYGLIPNKLVWLSILEKSWFSSYSI